MGAQFTFTTNRVIRNAATILADVPIVMGCWVNLTDIANTYTLFSHLNTGASSSFFEVHLNTTPFFVATTGTAGGNSSASGTLAPAAGKWYFVMGRFVSATNRWIVTFDPTTGVVDQVQNTVSRVPTIGTMVTSIGALDNLQQINGIIAEWFSMDADFRGSGGAALQADYVRKLALEGPFSLPDLSDLIVEYRSLKTGVDNSPLTDEWATGQTYSRAGYQTWVPRTAANRPTTTFHPPLSPNFILPPGAQTQQLLMV